MSLYNKVDYYYELAAFKLAQVIDRTKVQPSSIDPFGDRVAVSPKQEWDFTPKKIPQSAASQNNKPLGVWYAFGTDWITLIDAQGSYAYRLQVDDSQILKLNPSNIKDFIEKYSVELEGEDLARSMGIDVDNLPLDKRFAIKYMFTPKQAIDWGKVAASYKGVEITDMRAFKGPERELKFQHRFLDTWDVDSGCIWDTSAIKNVKKLGELPSFKGESESYTGSSSLFEGYWEDGPAGLKRIFEDKSGLVPASSLDADDLKFLSTNLIQYNIHLTQDQIMNVVFRVSPSSITLEKVPNAPSHEGKVINF